jgi:hypothetical protein
VIQGAEQKLTNRLTQEQVSCALTKDDVRKLLSILQERANTAAELEVASFQQLDQTEEVFEDNKRLLRDGFRLRITVSGENGQELYGPVDDVFESPNFPESVKSVYINSESYLRGAYNYTPHNAFELRIDPIVVHQVWAKIRQATSTATSRIRRYFLHR